MQVKQELPGLLYMVASHVHIVKAIIDIKNDSSSAQVARLQLKHVDVHLQLNISGSCLATADIIYSN